MTPKAPTRPRVLVAEDDASMRSILRFNLEEEGFAVTLASRGDEALELLAKEPGSYDLVVTDVKMPGANGMEVLAASKASNPDAEVVVVTAFGSVDDAIGAMSHGAADYITKPFKRAEFKARIAQALKRADLVRENRALRRARPSAILTESPLLLELLAVVDRVAPANVAVLITGESGTGKELVAQRLHESSHRAGRFVAVNCAALPANLLESELFGHERGAFTGATRMHAGKFEQADKGTIFLDEIGELPLELQSKLLRVLEEGSIDRVGGDRPQRVDVRVVSATNQDLEEAVMGGRFRADLFHRLSVIPVQLPPLRKRPEDVPVLARHFVDQLGMSTVTLAPALIDELQKRPWPGNVRELRNTISRMALLRRSDVLDLVDLAPPGTLSPQVATPRKNPAPPDDAGSPDGSLRPGALVLPLASFSLFELEQEIVLKGLDMHAGNRSATARYLQIPRHVLLYRLQKYGDTSTTVLESGSRADDDYSTTTAE